jgi:hypothetical protein
LTLFNLPISSEKVRKTGIVVLYICPQKNKIILLKNRICKRNNAHIGKREFNKLLKKNKKIFNSNDPQYLDKNNNENMKIMS